MIKRHLHFHDNRDGTFSELEPVQHYPKTLPSVTDKSAYSPRIVNVDQRVEGGSGGAGCFDFPDGVDTGERAMVKARRIDADITEIDALIKNEQSKVDSQTKRAKRKFDDTLETIKEGIKEKQISPSGSPASTTKTE